MQTIEINHHIPTNQQGQYLLVPFAMPPSTERIDIEYTYPHTENQPFTVESGQFTKHQRVNRIDLGLIAPDGSQVAFAWNGGKEGNGGDGVGNGGPGRGGGGLRAAGHPGHQHRRASARLLRDRRD